MSHSSSGAADGGQVNLLLAGGPRGPVWNRSISVSSASFDVQLMFLMILGDLRWSLMVHLMFVDVCHRRLMQVLVILRYSSVRDLQWYPWMRGCSDSDKFKFKCVNKLTNSVIFWGSYVFEHSQNVFPQRVRPETVRCTPVLPECPVLLGPIGNSLEMVQKNIPDVVEIGWVDQWIVFFWEHLDWKPYRFSHEDHGVVRLNFSQTNNTIIHWIFVCLTIGFTG